MFSYVSCFIYVSVAISAITPGVLVQCAPSLNDVDLEVSDSDNGAHSVQKRHILQMCELVAFHTNRGCLDYNNYGCFCGLGNAASTHVDAVDGCCRVHDECYGRVSCYWMYPQFVGYSVECNEDGCTCTDSSFLSSCAYTTCQCDLEFAQCLGRAPYNHGFSSFDRRECNRPFRARRRRRSARRQWGDLKQRRRKH